MKRFILALSMFSIWLAIASTYYMCVIKGMCNTTQTIEAVPTNTQKPILKKAVILDTNPIITSAEKTPDTLVTQENETATNDTLKITGLKIYDQNNLLKSYSGNFKIYKNSPSVRIPLGISEYGYVLAKHMDETDTELVIKGFYNQEETAEQGIQRATFIKECLTKLGIPSQLITTGTQSAIYTYNYNTFFGGIQFNFKKSDSVITLNRVDYSLFNNTKKEVIEDNGPLKETAVAFAAKNKITDADIDAITKKEPAVVPSAKAKKPTLPIIPKKERISYTVTEGDFRNEKFKASKNFRKFLETYQTAKSIQLMGYSNASENAKDNYNKGIKLANLVNSYIADKGSYIGKTTTNALKNKTLTTNGTIREGVTLIIQ